MFVFRRRSVCATHFFYLLPVFPPQSAINIAVIVVSFSSLFPVHFFIRCQHSQVRILYTLQVSQILICLVCSSSHTHSPFPFVIYRAITHSIPPPISHAVSPIWCDHIYIPASKFAPATLHDRPFPPSFQISNRNHCSFDFTRNTTHLVCFLFKLNNSSVFSDSLSSALRTELVRPNLT